VEVVPPGHAQAVALQFLGVLGTPAEQRDLAHARQMSGEQRPDHARADDANAIGHATASFPWR
jgi:hypothetical protein